MIRPVDAEVGQRFGENPTGNLPPNDPIILQFGNYQPDGHSGEDYKCGLGTPVRAVASGIVLHIGWMGGTYADNPWWIAPNFAGYCAVIDHGSFIGIYGHCTDGSAKVAKGQRVSEGQVFILSGNTGGSTGPHLHFEILPDGYILSSSFYGRIDPEPLFTGSLSYASESITPSEEDDMALFNNIDEFKRAVQEATQPAEDVTRNYLNEQDQARHDVTRAYLADTTQNVEDVTRQYLADRIKEASPETIANLVPADIAQQVIDALAARLAGK